MYCCGQVELQEVVDFFTKPKLFRSSGARIPKGVLLCGPPGAPRVSSVNAGCWQAPCTLFDSALRAVLSRARWTNLLRSSKLCGCPCRQFLLAPHGLRLRCAHVLTT